MSADPYDKEFSTLAGLAKRFIDARQEDQRGEMLMLAGMITAQCAVIYNLSPPAGIINPGEFFTGASE